MIFQLQINTSRLIAFCTIVSDFFAFFASSDCSFLHCHNLPSHLDGANKCIFCGLQIYAWIKLICVAIDVIWSCFGGWGLLLYCLYEMPWLKWSVHVSFALVGTLTTWICCRELSFKKGDAVNIIRQIDNNWYEGEHRGRVGIFPMSYVEVSLQLTNFMQVNLHHFLSYA